MSARSWWRTRRRRPASLATVLAVSALVLCAPLAGPAAAAPSDQPGGTSGVLDSAALDRLQQRAAEVQSGLQQRQAEVVSAQQELAGAQTQVQAAREALAGTE